MSNRVHEQVHKEIRVVLGHDEYKALKFFTDETLDYDNIPHFVREAITELLSKQGIIVLDRGKPRISRMTYDKRMRMLLNEVAESKDKWVSTRKISDRVGYDPAHIRRMLKKLEEDDKVESKLVSEKTISGRITRVRIWRWKRSYITKPLTDLQMSIIKQLEGSLWTSVDQFHRRTLKTLVTRGIVEMDDKGELVKLNFTFKMSDQFNNN